MHANKEWMDGKEILKRKYTKGQNIQYNASSNDDTAAILVYVNHKQQTIITRDMNYGVYSSVSTQNIKIILPQSTPSNSVDSPPNPLPTIPPKNKPFARIDFGLNLYYTQIGREYKNQNEKGKGRHNIFLLQLCTI